jgi:ribosomal-protein-alanine N-acetyltransferase
MFPERSTERLLLQQVVPDDQPFIFEGLSHPQVIPYYGVSYRTLEEAARQMEWYRTMVTTGTGIPWKLVLKETGEKMGVISVYFYRPEHRKAELGFWLLPQYWGKGYALEALQPIIRYWQQEKRLHRLEAFVETGNSASSKLLQRAGFQHEGTMRDCEIKNGRFISLTIYALIAGSR